MHLGNDTEVWGSKPVASASMLKKLAREVLVANERLPPDQRLAPETVNMLQERGVNHGRAEFTPHMISMLKPAQLGAGAGAGYSQNKVELRI